MARRSFLGRGIIILPAAWGTDSNMFVLERLTRKSPNEASCAITTNGVQYEFLARVDEDHLGLIGITFPGLSEKDEGRLADLDEFRAFVTVLFRFFEGNEFTIPMEIVSDYPMPQR
jgi:hypothetical protein